MYSSTRSRATTCTLFFASLKENPSSAVAGTTEPRVILLQEVTEYDTLKIKNLLVRGIELQPL